MISLPSDPLLSFPGLFLSLPSPRQICGFIPVATLSTLKISKPIFMIGRGITEVSKTLTSAFNYRDAGAYSSLFSTGLDLSFGL